MQGLSVKGMIKHPSLIPLFVCVGIGCLGSGLYLLRLATRNPDVSWFRKSNPEPWQEYANKQYKQDIMPRANPTNHVAEMRSYYAYHALEQMAKEKKDGTPCDFFVPLPIQTFFWRQTGSFIRPKHGRIHESSCISIEKVLVQNIQFGLSPSLTEAIHAIPRWKLIQAALPHVILCTAQLLNEKREVSLQNVGTAASKLLYTLHWALLDAGEECSDANKDKAMFNELDYVFPISTLELFIFLFAPLRHLLRDTDLQNFRLENGLKLWPVLWDHKHPNAGCFIQPVRLPLAKEPTNDFERRRKSLKGNPNDNVCDVFMGETLNESSLTAAKDDVELITEESSSEEHVVIFRLTSSPEFESGRASSIYKAPSSILKLKTPEPGQLPPTAEREVPYKSGPSQPLEPESKSSTLVDVTLATYLDIAAIRCLFNPTWNVDGVLWGLEFLSNRLQEIHQERQKTVRMRKRSSSLPIPQIHVSGCKSREVEEERISAVEKAPSEGNIYTNQETRKGRSDRKSQIQDLKYLLETNVAKIKQKKPGLAAAPHKEDISLLTSRPPSASVSQCPSLSASREDLSAPLEKSRMSKGKSMPSLSNILDELAARFIGGEDGRRGSGKQTANTSGICGVQPTITVTDLSESTCSINQETVSQGIPIYGRSHQPLGRSVTEPNIAGATSEEFYETPGVTCYITRDGGINLFVLIKGLWTVSKRPEVCSEKVCEVVLCLVDLLVDLGLLRDTFELTELAEKLPNLGKAESDAKDQQAEKWLITFEVVIRILSNMGCPYECDESHAQSSSEHARLQATHLLTRLHKLDGSMFAESLQCLVKGRVSLHILMQALHAFMGFCMEHGSFLSPPLQKRPSRVSADGTGLIGGIRPIEASILSAIFRPLVSRFVDKQASIKTLEHAGLYEQIRLFLSYVRDAHTSVFREVALSGLIDTTKGLKKAMSKADVQQNSESEPANDRKSMTPNSQDGGIRKFDSGSQMPLEENDWDQTFEVKKRLSLSLSRWFKGSKNKSRMRGAANTGRVQKISWLRPSTWFRRNPRREDRSIAMYDMSSLSSNSNASAGNKLSRRASTKATVSLQKARQRVEMHLAKIKLNRLRKNELGKSNTPDPSRRNSLEVESPHKDSETENPIPKRIVSKELLLGGMMRLGFLLEATAPGSIPEPHLMAAVLELPFAPVAARACFLLECAMLVRRCARGQWPSWMKSGAQFSASFRSVAGPLHRSNSGIDGRGRKSVSLQRAAGRLFHMWAELIAARLEDIMSRDSKNLDDVVCATTDAGQRKQLFEEDENEDFLNEAIVNPDGKSCPWALRLAACHLLFEITTFLRDTYRRLPRASKPSLRGLEKAFWGDRTSGAGVSDISHGTVTGMHSLGTFGPNLHRDLAARRWSTALSSVGHSQNSAQSLHSIPADGPPLSALVERKISFVLHEPDDESIGSSKSTLNAHGEEGEGRWRSSSRPHILKRGTISNTSRRRSLKLRKKEDGDALFKRTDSVRSRRKVSSSEKSDSEIHDVSGEESPGILSDEQPPESPSDGPGSGDDDGSLARHMPWLKVMINVASSFNFTCQHQNFCHPRCYRRQMRACNRLLHSVCEVYGEEPLPERRMCYGDCNMVKRGQNNSSPQSRRNSIGRHNKLESKSENSLFGKFGSKETIENDSGLMFECFCFPDPKKKEEETKNEPHTMLNYIKVSTKSLFHAPLAAIAKGAALLSDDHFADVAPVAWELLLEDCQEVVATAVAVFIMAAVRIPDVAVEIMTRQLTHADPNTRINAILSFHALWRHRYEVYPRLEEGAQVAFKVPLHSIEFTLPSPRLGGEWPIVADPPWLPETKSTVEEVTLNQEMQHRSLVTATKTRKRLELDMIETALQAEEDRKRLERETFHVTTVPVTTLASYEPALHHAAAEEHDDEAELSESLALRGTVTPVQPAALLFPSCLCSAAPYIAALIDDYSVTMDGVAVYEVALRVAHNCLIEDTSLFLRHFFERLTRERHEEVFRSLRKLLRAFPEIPQHSAYVVFNAMIGYIMFQVRSLFEGAQECINHALSIIGIISSFVQGIHLKDIKQILRKEQCDMALVLFANVPAAKKVVVHGPQGPDSGGIPSQFPVQEDTQFTQILQESLDFFGIEDSRQRDFYLVDLRTNQVHSPFSYVRDFYSFKRSQYPQLSLIRLRRDEAYNVLQQQAFDSKLGEIGKVLLMTSLLENSMHRQQRALFLYEELMKLPSFPRKALEVDFSLYSGGEIGKELVGMDFIHKLYWTRLVADIFDATAGTFASSGDVHIFLNVVNGALTLHAENATMLRTCLAVHINAALQFKNIFSMNGYFLIAPTLLKIYSNYPWDRLIRQAVEFTAQQLYILHRKPFLLQLLGAAAPLVTHSVTADYNKITPKDLFELLLSLEFNTPDPLRILDLVQADKPLKALDFCYSGEPDLTSVLECLNLCTLVISYASDSRRGYQLLTILNSLIPLTLEHYLEKKDLKAEKEAIVTIAVQLKTIVLNSEPLAKNYAGPQRNSTVTETKTTSYKHVKKQSVGNMELGDLEAHARFLGDHARAWVTADKDFEDNESLRNQFRLPRSVLLSVVAEFISTAVGRLAELAKKMQDHKVYDIFDVKSHARLADVAHTLLKEAPYDPACMSSPGLQRYMKEIMPACDWSADKLRPTLIMLMRRLDKLFVKVHKKHVTRQPVDWDAVSILLEGLYMTMNRHPYIIHIQYLRSLTATCQSLIMCETTTTPTTAIESSPLRVIASPAVKPSKLSPPPSNFCAIVLRLIGAQILSVSMYTHISMESQSLEQVCGGSSVFPTPVKTESVLLNLLLPLSLRVGAGKKDTLRLRHVDISFALTTIIHSLTPPPARSQSLVPPTPTTKTDPGRGSVSINVHPPEVTKVAVKPAVYRAAFLGFRIIVTCFEKQLALEWGRIAKCVREVGDRLDCGLHYWEFLLFVVTYRPPLYLLLKPFIWNKLIEQPESDQDLSMRESIREMMENHGSWAQLSKEDLLTDLSRELKVMRGEFAQRKDEQEVKRGASVLGDLHSEASNTSALSVRRNETQGPQSRCGSALGWGGLRGPSASHASLASGWSIGLQRQWSIRSDSQGATPVPPTASAEAQLALVEKLARRTSYAGEHAIPTFHPPGHSRRSASSEPRLHRRSWIGFNPAVSQTTLDSESSSTMEPGFSATRLQRRSQSRGRSMRGRKPSPLNAVEVAHIELDPLRDTPLNTPGAKSHVSDESSAFHWLQVPGNSSRPESWHRQGSSEALNWDSTPRRDSRQFLEPFTEFLSVDRAQISRSKSPAYGMADIIKVTPLLINVDDVIIEEQLSSPEDSPTSANHRLAFCVEEEVLPNQRLGLFAEEDQLTNQRLSFCNAVRSEEPVFETLESVSADSLDPLILSRNKIPSSSDRSKESEEEVRSTTNSSRIFRNPDEWNPGPETPFRKAKAAFHREFPKSESSSESGLRTAFDRLVYEHTSKFHASYENCPSKNESLQPLISDSGPSSDQPTIRHIPIELPKIGTIGSSESLSFVMPQSYVPLNTSLDEDTLI